MRMNMNLRPSHLRVDRAIRWLSRFFQPRLAFHGPEARINGDFYKKSRMWTLYKREFAELEGTEGMLALKAFRALVDAAFNYVRFLPADLVAPRPLTYKALPWTNVAAPVVNDTDSDDSEEEEEEEDGEEEEEADENKKPPPVRLVIR